MSRTDLISDCFTVLRNAVFAKKDDASFPYSGSMLKICSILKDEGYLQNYKEIDLEGKKKIKIYLRYDGKKNAITQIKKISTPGRRVYVPKKSIPRALGGYGITLISTSSGIMTDRKAKELGVGGEVIGMVW
tara:strand:- start:159 stop:554 length:396 start_codon:yes stop_codon:yes gene_type:complete